MKKVTRYCCPYCGKDNWDTVTCPEHRAQWAGKLISEEMASRNWDHSDSWFGNLNLSPTTIEIPYAYTVKEEG